MSRFNKYARRLDEEAKKAFEEYRKAEREYHEAEKKVNSYPKGLDGVVPQYQAEHARAQADFFEKRDAYKAAHSKFKGGSKVLSDIRSELEEAVNSVYAADPEKMDANTLELIRSGILNADEYTKLLEKAQSTENYTMCRLIGRYAADAAAARADKFGNNDPEARQLRAVAAEGNTSNGSEYLDAFDSLANVFDRCTNNTALIDSWDSIVSEAIEEF